MAFDFGTDPVAEEIEDDNASCLPIPIIDLPLDVGPRQWLYGTSLVRGMLSVLGGTGGVGKSRYAIKVALSIALGRPLLAIAPDEKVHRIHEPHGAVWYVSLEDPIEELQRNLRAEIKDNTVNPRDIWDRFYVSSGRDTPLIVAAGDGGGRLMRRSIAGIVKSIKEREIVLLVVDPFANSFDGGDGAESGSDAMKIILDQWRRVAHQANCAVWLIHHFRKGGLGGDADSFRGSSVIQNAARIMETLTTMTKDDAECFAIDASERRRFVKLENAKVNLSAAPAECQWFHFRGVSLDNGTAKYPEGDVIGVLNRWRPVTHSYPWYDIDRALTEIDGGCGNGEFYSSAPQSEKRWAGEVVMSLMGASRKQAVALIETWLKAGVLVKDSYSSPAQRKAREKLVVNPDAKMRLRGT